MRRQRIPIALGCLGVLAALCATGVWADSRSFSADGVSIELADSPDPVNSRGEVTYSYAVTNVSAQRIPDPPPPPFDNEGNSNILLQVQVAGSFSGTITSMSPERGSCRIGPAMRDPDDPGNYDYFGQCQLGILQPGETARVTIRVRVPEVTGSCPQSCVSLHTHVSWVGEPSGGVVVENPTAVIPEGGSGGTGAGCTRVKRGTAKADRLTGTSGNDKLIGRGGDDSLSGRGRHDCLLGGSGDDVLKGGSGKDSYSGGSGNDSIRAADGVKETIRCGPGRDSATVDRSDTLSGCENVRRR